MRRHPITRHNDLKVVKDFKDPKVIKVATLRTLTASRRHTTSHNKKKDDTLFGVPSI